MAGISHPKYCAQSLPLWDGVECFVDHAGKDSPLAGRSVRDLGGVCSSPGWDDIRQGIRLALTPIGPAADVIRAVGQEMLTRAATINPRVGFSADLLLRAAHGTNRQGKREVQEIIKVLSVDLVHNPARGGAFLQALSEGDSPQICLEKGAH